MLRSAKDSAKNSTRTASAKKSNRAAPLGKSRPAPVSGKGGIIKGLMTKNGQGKSGSPVVASSHLSVAGKSTSFRLPKEKLLRIHDLMVQARVLEERLIKMYKQSDGYFWIGAPGEESFSVPLGMQVKKGFGLDHDFLHLHYRSSPILLAMGAEPIDSIRQMKNTASDPYSGGRNFVNHFSKREWNVPPIASTIETQYASAIGTAIAQKRHGGDAITIVNGGDSGTAEGEFESCLLWASRPERELPILIIVTNNEWGISTDSTTQLGCKRISDRAIPWQMEHATINGLDVEESWFEIERAMEYVRKERKPFLLEARVTRLYGHSSATGANFVTEEADSLAQFEQKLDRAGILSQKKADELRAGHTERMLEMWKTARLEPQPDPSTIYDHTFHGQKGKYF